MHLQNFKWKSIIFAFSQDLFRIVLWSVVLCKHKEGKRKAELQPICTHSNGCLFFLWQKWRICSKSVLVEAVFMCGSRQDHTLTERPQSGCISPCESFGYTSCVWWKCGVKLGVVLKEATVIQLVLSVNRLSLTDVEIWPLSWAGCEKWLRSVQPATCLQAANNFISRDHGFTSTTFVALMVLIVQAPAKKEKKNLTENGENGWMDTAPSLSGPKLLFHQYHNS